MCRRQYALQILEDTGFLDSKQIKTPLNPRINLNLVDDDVLDDSTRYRRLIGRLLYLTITRPNITFAVNCLSQFVQAPKVHHLQVVHHLPRYIKSCPGIGLFIPSYSSTQLRAFFFIQIGQLALIHNILLQVVYL